MVLGASWSCIAPSPTRHNDHFEAILERNYVRPLNIVRKIPRFNKLHCKVFFRSVSPCFLTKTIGVAGLLPLCTAVALAESRVFARRSFTRLLSEKPAGVRCGADRDRAVSSLDSRFSIRVVVGFTSGPSPDGIWSCAERTIAPHRLKTPNPQLEYIISAWPVHHTFV